MKHPRHKEQCLCWCDPHQQRQCSLSRRDRDALASKGLRVVHPSPFRFGVRGPAVPYMKLASSIEGHMNVIKLWVTVNSRKRSSPDPQIQGVTKRVFSGQDQCAGEVGGARVRKFVLVYLVLQARLVLGFRVGGSDVARTHSQSGKHRQQTLSASYPIRAFLPTPVPGPHSPPLQYKPRFIKGFPSTSPGHHLSFKLHIIDEATITCGLQLCDVEARSPSGHDWKIDNSDSERGPVKQTLARIWETRQVPHIFPFNCYVPTSRISQCPTVVRSHLRRRVFNIQNAPVMLFPVLPIASFTFPRYRDATSSHIVVKALGSSAYPRLIRACIVSSIRQPVSLSPSSTFISPGTRIALVRSLRSRWGRLLACNDHPQGIVQTVLRVGIRLI